MIRRISGIFFFILFLVTAACAQTTGSTSSSLAASLVTISSVDSNPQVFFPGEEGTITVHLTNNANQSVGLSQPTILGDNIQVVNTNSFQTLTYIGPGSTLDVSFDVIVEPPDGTYFPLFTIGTKDSNSIHYPIKLVIDSTDIKAGVSQRPDNFAISRQDTVNLTIVNPRDGPINNVVVTADGPGLYIIPSESFTSILSAGSSVNLPFAVTPSQRSNLTFHIAYENGDNKHAQDIVLPINVGEDKTGANPVVNNIAITYQGTSYLMTGDVSNAGITDAEAMVLTVTAPARPVEPYASYAVGTLASDDFSSFTLTFTATDLSSVPVQVQWKDLQGNTFTNITRLDLRVLAGGGSGSRSSGSPGNSGGAASGTTVSGGPGGGAARGGGGFFPFGGGRGGGLSSFFPILAGGIILVAVVVIWMKRKWVLSKIRKQPK